MPYTLYDAKKKPIAGNVFLDEGFIAMADNTPGGYILDDETGDQVYPIYPEEADDGGE